MLQLLPPFVESLQLEEAPNDQLTRGSSARRPSRNWRGALGGLALMLRTRRLSGLCCASDWPSLISFRHFHVALGPFATPFFAMSLVRDKSNWLRTNKTQINATPYRFRHSDNRPVNCCQLLRPKRSRSAAGLAGESGVSRLLQATGDSTHSTRPFSRG
jgi:hypothetical protein